MGNTQAPSTVGRCNTITTIANHNQPCVGGDALIAKCFDNIDRTFLGSEV
jgi:hypothetical protein